MGNFFPSPDPAETIRKLNNLKPGQREVYYTGMTGWLERYPENHSLMNWCLNAQESGLWIFCQKKIFPYGNSGVSVYQYIAIRRRHPEPVNNVVNIIR